VLLKALAGGVLNAIAVLSQKSNRPGDLVRHALTVWLADRPQLKVFYPVVIANTMLVVDLFVRKQRPAKVCFHDKTMLHPVTLFRQYLDIAGGRTMPTPGPQRVILSTTAQARALRATKHGALEVEQQRELLAALRAELVGRNDGPRVAMTLPATESLAMPVRLKYSHTKRTLSFLKIHALRLSQTFPVPAHKVGLGHSLASLRSHIRIDLARVANPG
jgi:hypothetical protein